MVVRVKIDRRAIDKRPGQTVLAAALDAGIYIPHMQYLGLTHSRLLDIDEKTAAIGRPDARGLKDPRTLGVGTYACSIYGDSYCLYLPGNTRGFTINSGRMAGYYAIAYMEPYEF